MHAEGEVKGKIFEGSSYSPSLNFHKNLLVTINKILFSRRKTTKGSVGKIFLIVNFWTFFVIVFNTYTCSIGQSR